MAGQDAGQVFDPAGAYQPDQCAGERRAERGEDQLPAGAAVGVEQVVGEQGGQGGDADDHADDDADRGAGAGPAGRHAHPQRGLPAGTLPDTGQAGGDVASLMPGGLQ